MFWTPKVVVDFCWLKNDQKRVRKSNKQKLIIQSIIYVYDNVERLVYEESSILRVQHTKKPAYEESSIRRVQYTKSPAYEEAIMSIGQY